MPIMGEYTKPEADIDIATHAALTTGVHGVGTGQVGSKPINRLAGILGVASGFNTDPTNLAYATDEDWSTATGLGSNTNVAAWNLSPGVIKFDMGAIYTVHLFTLFTIGGTYVSQNVNVYFSASMDDSTYYPCELVAGTSLGVSIGIYLGNSSQTAFFSTIFHGRYLKVQASSIGCGNISTLRLGITEIQAIDLGV